MHVRTLTPAPTAVLVVSGLGAAAYAASLAVAPGLVDADALGVGVGISVLAAAAALGSLHRVLRERRCEPVAWALQAVALAALVVAEAAILVRGPRLADVADAAFLVGCVVLVAAVTLRRSDRGVGIDPLGPLDTGLIAVPLVLAALIVLVAPIDLGAPSPLIFTGMAVAHPVVDVLLLVTAVRLVLATTSRSSAVLLTVAGLVALAGADVAHQLVDGPGPHATGPTAGATRAGFLLAYALLAAMAIHPGTEDRLEPPAQDTAVSTPRVVVLGMAAAAPPAFLVVYIEWSGRFDPGVVHAAALATMAVGLLAMLRVAHVVRSVRTAAVRAGAAGLSALVEHSTDVIAVVDAEGMVRYASPALRTALGYDPDRFVGSALRLVAHPDDVASLTNHLFQATKGAPRSTSAFETRLVANDGTVRAFEVTSSNLLKESAVDGLALTLRDVTDRMALSAELRHQAFHDSLTGLANRDLFADRLDHALHRRRRDPSSAVAILFIDLDDFKAVNDGLGHAAGDALLRSVAHRIVGCLRSGDTAARFGGDEFAVLLEDHTQRSEAEAVAARILEALLVPVAVGDLEIGAAASVGAIVAEEDSDTLGLLRDADIAMYEAKRSGKGRMCVFDPSMRDSASARLALHTDLSTALESGELRVVYQPIVALDTGFIEGAEALVRWRHPTRGEVAPDGFIPAAEQTGLIVSIGAWVMTEACRQAASTYSSVGVNVSGVQFASPDFLGHVAHALSTSGLPASRLTVEITETALMADTDATARVLDRLRSVGVRVAIDDFGTGYCSLAYLQRFAVDVVKIDRAFVAEVDQPSKSSRLARTIMQMADSLEVTKVVAEGIETEEQLVQLRALGCRHGQGFLLSRPLEQPDYAGLLARQRRDRALA